MAKLKNLKGTIYYNASRGTYRFRYGRTGTTKTFKLKREAEAYQVEFTQNLKKNGTAALDTLRSSTEAKQAFDLLAQHQLPPSTLVDAVRYYISNTNPSSRKTVFSDALAEVMQTGRFKGLAKGTQNDYRQRWQLLANHVGSSVTLSDVTPRVLEVFLKERTASTRYKYYVALNVLWQTYFIGVTRLTKFNPLKEIKDPPAKPKFTNRKEPYTCDEVFTLLGAAEQPSVDREDVSELAKLMTMPKLSVALHLAFFTGLRSSEICRLQVKDFHRGSTIDWENNPYINLPASKTKEQKAKRVLVPPCLVEYLRHNNYFNSLSAEQRVYPHAPRTLRESMQELCAASGVPWKGSATTRTTFGTHAIDGLFKSLSETSRQLGHSTSETSLKHYVNFASVDDCERYFCYKKA